MNKFTTYIKGLYKRVLLALSPLLRSLHRHAPLLAMGILITTVLMVLCYIYDNTPHSLLGSITVR